MTLTTRLTVYFLIVLGIVLALLTGSVWGLVRWSLYGDLAGRVDHIMSALVASVEIEPDGVEWNPKEHEMLALRKPVAQDIAWAVLDPEGRILDHSELALPVAASQNTAARANVGPRWMNDATGAWFVLVRQVEIGDFALAARPHVEETHPDDVPEYPRLTFVAAISNRTIEQRLMNVLLGVFLAALVLWMLCALLSRRACRQALRPVREMAAAAARIEATHLDRRLPVAPARDELQDLAVTFNTLLDRLESAFSQERRFAADASHQLRTPLTVMLGELDVTLLRDREGPVYKDTLERVRQQARRLIAMVESLLWLARTDFEAQSEASAPLELGAWLRDWLQRRDVNPRVRLELRSSEPTSVAIRPLLLEQALGNLVDNALRYGPADRPVTVALATNSTEATLSIHNEGASIAPDDLSHVFEPFFRSTAPTVTQQSGSGLGLPIVHRIVTLHGGTITVTSTAAAGTTFRIHFPRKHAADSSWIEG